MIKCMYVRLDTAAVVSVSTLPTMSSLAPDGCYAVEVPLDTEVPNDSTFIDGVVVPPPPVDPLPGARAAAWERIKQERAMRITAPISTPAGTFDADEQSQARILAAIQLADIVGPTWETTWTLADNTSVTVTRSDLVAVVMAVGERANQTFAQARALRARIDGAALEELDGITWAP